MTDVLIARTRLRQLEITAELGTDVVKAIEQARGDLVGILEGIQEAMAAYLARMAVSDAMDE